MVHIKQNPDNSELSNMAEVEVVTVGNCEPIQIVVTIGYWDTLQITVTVGYCDPCPENCYRSILWPSTDSCNSWLL